MQTGWLQKQLAQVLDLCNVAVISFCRLLCRNQDQPPVVLMPGAGLCRLVCELAGHHFSIEANEHSFYMLLFSSLMLNHCSEADVLEVAPYVMNSSN